MLPTTDPGAGAAPRRPRSGGARSHGLFLRAVSERRPGPSWRSVFEHTWPAYRAWYLSEGDHARPSLAVAEQMLRRHMPELVDAWRRLVELAGGDELVARMLTLYDPPAFQPGCTQAVCRTEHGPVLVRNYDYGPGLFEQVMTSTTFAATSIIGTSDCLWGLLDGMNGSGLIVSLAYGGRPGTGPGFGIPLVVRYLLEICDTVAGVRRALSRLPINASYNLTVLDAAGSHLTAYVAPGVPPVFSRAPVAANHPVGQADGRATVVGSIERQEAAAAAVALSGDLESLVQVFLHPPLHNTRYSAAFGTLYTAVYRAHRPGVEYRWPGSRWDLSFETPDGSHPVALSEMP